MNQYRARFAWYKNGSLASQSVFNPIPNLVRTDSDVLLFFLSAGSIFFTSPASDDWYRGTKLVDVARRAEASNDTSENPTIDIYAQDEPASPMACVSQEQYCNPNLPEGSRCGPLSSRLDSWYSSYPALFPEQAMQDRVKWFWDATLTVDNAVAYLGSQSLTSRNSLSGGAQGPLPDNQWHLDVQNWFETRLAYMQAYFVDLATGPSDISLQQYVVKPNSTGEQSICRNQVYTPLTLCTPAEANLHLSENPQHCTHLFQPFRPLLHLLSWKHHHRRIIHHRTGPWLAAETPPPRRVPATRMVRERDPAASAARARGHRLRDMVSRHRYCSSD